MGPAASGPLTEAGRTFLREMEHLGVILDATPLSDSSCSEAIERFQGPVIASHCNCRALVPGDRQLDDAILRRLIERDAVVGTALDAWMLEAGWIAGKSTNENLTIDAVVDQIDHVCQLAGD